MANIVTLDDPVTGHNGIKITALEFRDPVYSDYMAFGEPAVWVETSSGASYIQENPAVIDDYARKLLVQDPNFLDGLPLNKAIEIKQVILGFFQRARSTGSVKTPGNSSGASPASSSSAGGSIPKPSNG